MIVKACTLPFDDVYQALLAYRRRCGILMEGKSETDKFWTTVVPPHAEGMPLAMFLASEHAGRYVSMSFARRVCRHGKMYVNGKVAFFATKVSGGDYVLDKTRDASRKTLDKLANCNQQHVRVSSVHVAVKSWAASSTVLFDDDFLLAMTKPAGVLVHPPQIEHDLGEATIQALVVEKGAVAPLHRLDRDTSGVLLFSKSAEVTKIVKATWSDRTLTAKVYLGLVTGAPATANWFVNTPLAKPCMGIDRKKRNKQCISRQRLDGCSSGSDTPGDAGRQPESCGTANSRLRPATTAFQLVKSWTTDSGHQLSLLQCELVHGGRTHQIRRHIQLSGHHLYGDLRYGCSKVNRAFKRLGGKRMCLHAWHLRVRHPSTGLDLVLQSPLPPDFKDVLAMSDGGLEAMRLVASQSEPFLPDDKSNSEVANTCNGCAV